MVPGPTKIVACPNCRRSATYRTSRSFSIFDEIQWSDGFRYQWAQHNPPAIVVCRGCREVHWLKDAAVLGELAFINESTSRKEWDDANPVKAPDEAEYHSAIQRGLARTPDEEGIARRLAWWRSNDPLRESGRTALRWYSSDDRDANMEALLARLEDDESSEPLVQVELLRELGRFREAIDLLDRMPADDLGDPFEVMRDLCERRDDRMQRLDRKRVRKSLRNPGRRSWWRF